MNLTCCKSSRLALSAVFQISHLRKSGKGNAAAKHLPFSEVRLAKKKTMQSEATLSSERRAAMSKKIFFRRFLGYRSQIIGHKHPAAALNPNK
jgi:hypothetical protein